MAEAQLKVAMVVEEIGPFDDGKIPDSELHTKVSEESPLIRDLVDYVNQHGAVVKEGIMRNPADQSYSGNRVIVCSKCGQPFTRRKKQIKNLFLCNGCNSAVGGFGSKSILSRRRGGAATSGAAGRNTASKLLPVSKSDELPSCPYCGVQCSAEQMMNHIEGCPEKPLAWPLAKRLEALAALQSPATKAAMREPCPFCGIQVRVRSMQKHIMAKCPKRLSIPKSSGAQSPQARADQAAHSSRFGELQPCPLCGLDVRADRMEQHRNLDCLNSPPSGESLVTRILEVLTGQVTSEKVDRGLRPCSYCGVDVRLDRMEEHKSRKCPQRPVAGDVPLVPKAQGFVQQTANRATGTKGQPVRGPHSSSHTFDRQKAHRSAEIETTDRRDASKGWGHAFREHGRFGSFPVHDGYGDESEP